MGIHLSPQAYLLDQLGARSMRHQGNGATATPPRCNTTIIAGDFNAAWDGRHGPLASFGYWAATVSLISPTAAQSTATDPIHSYYRGSAPTSLIDHILITQACHGAVLSAGVFTGSFFGSLSDHRPVTLGINLAGHLAPACPTSQPLRRPLSRPIDLDLATEGPLLAYQQRIAVTLPPVPFTAQEARDALRLLSFNSAAAVAPPTNRKGLSHGNKRFDGCVLHNMASEHF